MKVSPVTVVIPSYNRIATLKGCIQGIRDTAGHPDFEIVVVDGGSDDGSVEWLEQQPDVRLLQVQKRGVAMAVNLGIAQSGRRDVVRLHSDVIMETDGWLLLLSEAARDLPGAGVVGGQLLLPDDRIQSAGRSIITGAGLYERHADRKTFQSRVENGKAVEVDGVPGALCYMTRETLDATGGLDEGYWPIYMDDDDFCMMARQKGFKVYVHEGVQGVHHTSTWTPTTSQHINSVRGTGVKLDKLNGIKVLARNLHVEHWVSKWGWNPRFPDLSEIRRLYGKTEICWRIGESMRYREPGDWPPTVDVVMVTWNNLAVLKRCMNSLAKTSYPAEKVRVHITDNGSRDGTLEYLKCLQEEGVFPFKLVLHCLPVNTGCPIGFNWSIAHGQAELVARLDDDVIVPPEWLDSLVQTFRRRPFAGVVGPKILNDTAHNDIQCAGFRMYPWVYGHENEPDEGQADYVARVSHVRGCCNVYRRQALDDCGLFDLRFSPSQADDPDHHAALLVSGFEVIYDGHVGVIHALNSGAGRTYSAVSNQIANQSKLLGKWGREIWRILDQSLELSHEGRFLPDDGDTSEFMASLDPVDSYPRVVEVELSEKMREERLKVIELRERALSDEGGFGQVWEDILEQARTLRRDGLDRLAAPLLHSMVDLRPDHFRALSDLALTYLRLGELDRARTLCRRAGRLAPGEQAIADLAREIERCSAAAEQAGPASGRYGHDHADRSGEIGEPTLKAQPAVASRNMKVLMVNTFERRVAGGDMVQIKKSAQYLRKLGVDVTISYTARPDPRGYDLIHVFNLWFPQQTLPQVKGLRVAAPQTPIVMTPIYWDMAEKDWADHVVPRLFAQSKSEAELAARLQDLKNDTLTVAGLRRSDRREPNFGGYELYQREILKHVSHLFPISKREVENLWKTLGVALPHTVVYNGAEPAVFDQATPDLFRERYGIGDFVLTVGLLENRKNQLMLLHALKRTGIPVVVIGRNYDRNYFRLCQRYCGPDTLFIEHMPHEELASAMKAAKVFALPSWMECAPLVNVEAALSGCALVVSDRTSESEYYGDCAYYCDPADVDSIRDAVLKADRYYETDAPKREKLRERCLRKFTWEGAAEKLVSAYEKVLSERWAPGVGARTEQAVEVGV
ncbi:MAG: glycosyltransferase [Planctomycetota bacterium]